MKFLSTVITLSKDQYVIRDTSNKDKILKALDLWFRVILVVILSTWAGCEHINYVMSRKIEIAVCLIAYSIIVVIVQNLCLKPLHKIPA